MRAERVYKPTAGDVTSAIIIFRDRLIHLGGRPLKRQFQQRNYSNYWRALKKGGCVCEPHPGRPWEGEHACTCGGAGAPCPRSNVPENDKAPRCRTLRIKISKFLQPAQPSKP